MTKYVSKPNYVNAIPVKEAICLATYDWYSLPKWVIDQYDKGNCIFTPHGIHIPDSYNVLGHSDHKKWKVAENNEMLVLGEDNQLNSYPTDIFLKHYDKVTE